MTRAIWLRGLLLALACLTSAGAMAALKEPWQRHNAAGLQALPQRRFAAALREAESRLGRFAEAAPHLESALAMRERAYGPAHWEVGQTLYNLGVLHHIQGDLAKAEPYTKER